MLDWFCDLSDTNLESGAYAVIAENEIGTLRLNNAGGISQRFPRCCSTKLQPAKQPMEYQR